MTQFYIVRQIRNALGLLAADSTDSINEKNITVRNESEASTSVYISWLDPPSPNGLIVTYELELNKADAANVSLTALS